MSLPHSEGKNEGDFGAVTRAAAAVRASQHRSDEHLQKSAELHDYVLIHIYSNFERARLNDQSQYFAQHAPLFKS